MNASVAVRFTDGTHRAMAPAETLRCIAPHLGEMGITRLADMTGLDRLGIPTWCAVRPSARQVQISNGKGLSHDAAKVSALMEAVEHWHAENPPGGFMRVSSAALVREGQPVVPPQALPNYRAGLHLTDQRVLDWIRGESLPGRAPVWLPACAAFLWDPQLIVHSTNGLASGNHLVEATLHALYEAIERDAVTRLSRGGLSLPCGRSRVVDLDTLPRGPVAALRDRIRAASVSLYLVRVDSIAPVVTFWAVLIDPASPFACSKINMGHGSHLSGVIAATRAITEAAQSRLTFIHGAREDLAAESYTFTDAHERLQHFFQCQRGELDWCEITESASGDLATDLDRVLAGLGSAGYRRCYRIDLTQPRFEIPVVKVMVPGLQYMDGFLARHHDV